MPRKNNSSGISAEERKKPTKPAASFAVKQDIQPEEQAKKFTINAGKHAVSFRPLHVFQGLVVFLAFLILGFSLFPKPALNKDVLIQTAQTIQASPIVAGGKSVQWAAMVDKSQITQDKTKQS